MQRASLALAAFALLALASISSTAVEYGPYELGQGANTRLVDDSSAYRGKAVYLEQSSPGKRVVANVTTAPLPIGSYEIAYHAKVAARGNTITPILRFEIGEPEVHRLVDQILTPYNVEKSDVFVDYTFMVNHSSETPLQVTLSSDAPVTVWIDRIRIEPIQQFRIASVWPGKILYASKVDASGIVTLDNGTETGRSGRLVVEVVGDLEESRRVAEIPVQLPPMGRVDVPIRWNTGSEDFGFEMRATLLDPAGKLLDTRATVFSVSDDLWKVAMMGSDMPWNPRLPPAPYPLDPQAVAEQDERYAKALLSPTVTNDAFWPYNNWREYYAWAPDDFFDLTPTRPLWWSGTGWYLVSRKSLLASVELGHRLGVRQITYAQPFAIGDKTYPETRVHPDYFVYDAEGRLHGSFDVRSLDLQRNPPYLAYTVEELQKRYPYVFASLNFANPGVVDRGVTEIVSSAKMFGWDGVRWDNTYYRVDGDAYDFEGKQLKTYGDPQNLSIHLLRHVKDRLALELGPHFSIGYNVEYTLHRESAPRAWDELPKGGALLMNESIRASADKAAATNRWSEYAARINREGNYIRSLGGHSLIIGLDQQNPVDQLYQQIFTFAGRVHSYGAYRFFDLPYGNYAQFATRYSAFLFDIERLRPLEAPDRKIRVQGEREIWWKDWACVRTPPDGRRQYIIHLINPPSNERIFADPSNAVPLKQRNIRVTLTTGEALVAASLLTAEPTTHATTLEVGADGRSATVTVPELAFWSMLVLEVRGPVEHGEQEGHTSVGPRLRKPNTSTFLVE